jgi:preprotein translocase subunit Sss1
MSGIEKLAFGIFLVGTVGFYVYIAILTIKR